MTLISDLYSFLPCLEESLVNLFMATARPCSLRKPRYTVPKPPCPSFSSAAKLLVASDKFVVWKSPWPRPHLDLYDGLAVVVVVVAAIHASSVSLFLL